jgi:hypothetical protein
VLLARPSVAMNWPAVRAAHVGKQTIDAALVVGG